MNNCRVRGKEYYKNGKLKYEGEYLYKDKLNGKFYDYDGNVAFKLYNNNGIIEDNIEGLKIFIGENIKEKILNEKVYGKEYNINGRLLFEGEYLNKKRWKGKINKYNYVNNNELIFEGELLDGKIWNGKGEEYDINGNLSFEGEYINGKKSGYSKIYTITLKST